MSASSGNTGGGIGFAGMLTILFIGLKLTNNIDWPWLWVLSPLWITAGVLLAILVICLFVLGVLKFIETKADKKRSR